MKKILFLLTMSLAFFGCDDKSGSDTNEEWLEGGPRSSLPIFVTDIRTNIDADQPELIEADIERTTMHSVGNEFVTSGENLAFIGSKKKVMVSGTYNMEEGVVEWKPAYDFMQAPHEGLSGKRLVFTSKGGDVFYYDCFSFFIEDWLCEDLTEYYQAEYPDAGVRSVARVTICSLMR